MSHSKWLKTDLHIHSHMSKKTKCNDYDGEDLNYDKLIEALKREGVNLFSITDHNTLNLSLYEELISRRKELIFNNLNFIVGAEIDFFDEEIHDKIFHMLVYFNSIDLIKVSKVLTDLYEKEKLDDIDMSVSPVSLNNFFKKVFDNGIEDIITIPHFNNKDKGIPPKDQIDRFIYTVFNALEDSNNRNNLVKSLCAFKNSDYNDVPIVVFSDNHNIDKYPCGKNGDKKKLTSMFVLGNVEFPFESIKLAFQDVNTRISIDNLEMRHTSNNNKYIKAININEKVLKLSEYQNTIIGGFGTGKSFLLDMILNGKNNISQKYTDLASKYENFNLTFSDDTTRSSLSEVKEDIKIIKFDQYKDIYFKNILLEDDKNVLEQNLHISFPQLEAIKSSNEENLIGYVNSMKQNYEDTAKTTDIISYDAYSRRNEKSYTFKTEVLQSFYEAPQYLDDLRKNLQEEFTKKVLGINIYSFDEKEVINHSEKIISTKNCIYEKLSNNIENILGRLEVKISDINTEINSKNAKISGNILIIDDIKQDIKLYIDLMKKLKNETSNFEQKYSKENYDNLKLLKKEIDLYGYKLIAQYNAAEEYFDYTTDILKPQFRKANLFKNIIMTLKSKETFTQSQSFTQRLEHFVDKYYSNFQKICYDIYDNDISIMKKSAGEKANVIINIIFKIIEDYSLKEISSIVILDQPEDNLDNKGIQKEVVERIRSMKSLNYMPQLICVTHNANISITADSENIILARKEEQMCSYINSGIENAAFINEVCMVVEGGQTALKRRGSKFNIPIIKELERGI